MIPLVDFNACEAKGPCIDVCPYDVFEMKVITPQDFGQLSFMGKIKTRVHGSKKAYAVKLDQCHGCGLCVVACPEKAIKLKRV